MHYVNKHYGILTSCGAKLVNIGSGNGLLSDGTKPLPGPMFATHQWNSPEDSFTGNAQDIYPWYKFENY